jgi:hypothetical protein
MLSVQLCLSLAPLLAGSEARPESLQSLTAAIPYHLIARAEGQLLVTTLVLSTDDDDDDDDDDREERRDGDRRKQEGGAAEGRRPHPGRPEAHHPEGPGHPHGAGEHRPQPDHKGAPHQGPPEHGQQPSPPHDPSGPGGFRPPMMGMGMPHFGGMFGHGAPFDGRPGMQPGQPSGHAPGSAVWTGIIFELLDQNHDGNLSRGEFQKLADAVQKSHHPPMIMQAHFGPGQGPEGDHGRPQLSRRGGPPMLHQGRLLLQAHKPDADRKPDADHKADGDHRPDSDHHSDGDKDRKPERGEKEDHRDDDAHGRDRHRPDGERGEKSREHQEPRI